MMDTSKLVVGQDVYVVSSRSRFFCQGKVTKVAPEGVEVLTVPTAMRVDELPRVDYDANLRSWVVTMRFDNEGNNGSDGADGQDVDGFGPWRIDDMPFAERKSSGLESPKIIV